MCCSPKNNFKALLFILVFAFSPLVFKAQDHSQHEAQPDAHATETGAATPAHEAPAKEKKFDAAEVIFGHVLDGHEYHFMDIGTHPVTLPLPIILYSPSRDTWDVFMSSHFEHGHATYKGYTLLTKHTIHELELDQNKFSEGTIIPLDANGKYDPAVTYYDLSMTRNVVQMLLALIIFTVIMFRVAGRYKKGVGVTSAPQGSQSLLEPIITFVRDEVAKPNLGHKYQRYLPFLLTVFFFILVNNIFGLIPGSANVTGNIAFTVVLGLLSFIVILFSSNKHYWGHIFNPPGVPLGVKFILVPVEFLSVFIKPFALIIRLFANMVAGHIIIICLISLIFIFGELSPIAGWGAAPLSIGFTVFIYLIEVLVAFLQAFIFTMLSAVFIGQALEGDHHDAADGAHH
ncbi:MAG: F0F1 ATP synthase subunit A [Bacteroidetes bacterium]|nr:F0F1 ATP synthase subunit A [Bacteroidota bacterium]